MTGKAQKLGLYHKSDLCDACQQAEGATKFDADFEAVQGASSIEHARVTTEDGSLAARLTVLKENLVAQLMEQRGRFWIAVWMVRSRWGITPVSGLPGEDASPNVLYPEAIEGADDRVNVARRWLDDLYGALLVCVPEEYLGEDRAPWVGHPPIPASRAPWVAFASACVLYDPRAETADRFARYGGLPALESGGEGRRLEVRTPDQQREEEVAAEAREIFRELLEEKTWELRHEDLDYGRARHKVVELYGYEMWEQAKLRAEASVPEERPDEPRYYTLKFDPTQHTEKDLKLTRGAILEKEGLRHHSPGNLKQSRLLGVRVRHFLQREGWTEELMADKLNLSVERIRQLNKDAQ